MTEIIAPGGESLLATIICGVALGFCFSKLSFPRSGALRFMLFNFVYFADLMASIFL